MPPVLTLRCMHVPVGGPARPSRRRPGLGRTRVVCVPWEKWVPCMKEVHHPIPCGLASVGWCPYVQEAAVRETAHPGFDAPLLSPSLPGITLCFTTLPSIPVVAQHHRDPKDLLQAQAYKIQKRARLRKARKSRWVGWVLRPPSCAPHDPTLSSSPGYSVSLYHVVPLEPLPPRPVVLSVGGEHFSVLKDTFADYPDSVLHGLCSGAQGVCGEGLCVCLRMCTGHLLCE